MFRALLVPVDFSPTSIEALRLAVRIAQSVGGGALTLLHIGLPPELYYGDLAAYGFGAPDPSGHLRDRIVAEQTAALERLAVDEIPAGVPFRTLRREGYAPDEILAEAEGAYDLLVMGTHGRAGLSRALLGSVTERVVRVCPKPVLVTRGPSGD